MVRAITKMKVESMKNDDDASRDIKFNLTLIEFILWVSNNS